MTDGTPDVGLSEDEREAHTYMAVEGPMFNVPAVDAILRTRLAAVEAAHARDLAALAYLGKVDSSGRPSNDRDGSCTCDYNPETTDGPVEDCPFHGRPYAYWMERGDRLAERAEVAEGAVVRANAVLNSYGIRGQLWHDLNAILTPAIAALATPPGRSGTADPEART